MPLQPLFQGLLPGLKGCACIDHALAAAGVGPVRRQLRGNKLRVPAVPHTSRIFCALPLD